MSFPRYESYKDSGVEWLGEVPEGWEVVQLKYVIKQIESGTSVNAADEPATQKELGVLKTSCVYSGQFNANENKTVDQTEVERVSCPLKASTVIVSRMNTPELVGAAGLVKFAPNNLYLPDRLWQISFTGAKPDFVYYWTQSRLYRGQMRIACAGTSSSMQNLGQDQFRAFFFPNPPLSEQSTIAAFLDFETAQIDALIAEQQKLIALLKEKRQAVISHAVTKGLDPTVPMKDSGIEWLKEVPAHWEIVKLKHVVNPDTSITYGIVQAGPHFDGGIPYIKTSDMSEDTLPLDGYSLTSPEIDAAYIRSKVAKGDLVIAIRATVGKCLPIPDELDGANLTQGTARISPGEKVLKDYLLALINSKQTQIYFDQMAKGATFKEITLDALRRTPLPLPLLAEQKAISEFLNQETTKIDELTTEAQRGIELLKERRSALISAAVTGKIDVRGWTPPEAV